MAYIEQCGWHLDAGAGVNQRWWTLPLEVQAERLHVNYASLGVVGGGVDAVLKLYIARFKDYFTFYTTYVPVKLLDFTVTAGMRYSRVALLEDTVAWGGQFVLILVANYAAPPAGAELRGPAVAVDGQVSGRFATYNTTAFDDSKGVNFNGVISPLYNNASLQTDPEFAFNQPWVELYWTQEAFVPPAGEGGGGLPPDEKVEIVIPDKDADARIQD